MTAPASRRYFAHSPLSFSRLHGPWPPCGQGQATLRQHALSRFRALRSAGVLQWYARISGNAAPRMPKPDALCFGPLEMLLTSSQARDFSRQFPSLHLVRDRKLRLGLRSSPGLAQGPASTWHLDQTGVAAARSDGWASRGAGVTVAVVDSGIDANHPEFAGKTIMSRYFPPDGSPGQSGRPPSGVHGTHIAALIAGATVGLAPDADIVDVQACGDGGPTVGSLTRGLWFAASAPGVRIINLSAGFTQFIPDLQPVFEHLAASGIIVVCAAGNRQTGVDCPAIYESPITVGAMNENQTVRTLSGSGSIQTASGLVSLPDLVGPGENVCSAIPGGHFAPLSGTSQATAVISGLAALRISDRNGDLSAADLVAQLLTHTRRISDTRAGQGLGFYNRLQ